MQTQHNWRETMHFLAHSILKQIVCTHLHSSITDTNIYFLRKWKHRFVFGFKCIQWNRVFFMTHICQISRLRSIRELIEFLNYLESRFSSHEKHPLPARISVGTVLSVQKEMTPTIDNITPEITMQVRRTQIE